MANWGGTHQWKMGFDLQLHPVRGRQPGRSARLLHLPEGHALQRERQDDVADPVHGEPAPLRERPDQATSRSTSRTTGRSARGLTFNLGLRYDRQIGLVQRGHAALAGTGRDKRRRRVPDRHRAVPHLVAGLAEARRPEQLRPAHRLGVGSDQQRQAQRSRRLWPVLRQHPDADELRRDCGGRRRSRSSSTIPTFGNPLGGKPANRTLTATPNIWVMDPKNFKTRIAHQINAGFTYLLTRDHGPDRRPQLRTTASDRDPDVDINLPDQVTRVKPYPQYARMTMLQSSQNNTYKALLVKIEKRLSHRHQYMVSYTLARPTTACISNTPGRFLRLPAGGQPRLGRPAAPPRGERHRAVAVRRSRCRSSATSGRNCRSTPAARSTSTGTATPVTLRRASPSGAAAAISTWTAINVFRAIPRPGGGEGIGHRLSWLRQRGPAAVSKFITFGAGAPDRADRPVVQRLQPGELRDAGQQPRRDDVAGKPPTFGSVRSILANINAPSRQVELAVRYQF